MSQPALKKELAEDHAFGLTVQISSAVFSCSRPSFRATLTCRTSADESDDQKCNQYQLKHFTFSYSSSSRGRPRLNLPKPLSSQGE
jgi:hypothetical protein